MFIKSALYTCRLQPTGVTDYNVFAIKVSISNVFSQKNCWSKVQNYATFIVYKTHKRRLYKKAKFSSNVQKNHLMQM